MSTTIAPAAAAANKVATNKEIGAADKLSPEVDAILHATGEPSEPVPEPPATSDAAVAPPKPLRASLQLGLRPGLPG